MLFNAITQKDSLVYLIDGLIRRKFNEVRLQNMCDRSCLCTGTYKDLGMNETSSMPGIVQHATARIK